MHKGDKLFEKDSKLCLRTEQLLILQEYLEQITSNPNTSNNFSSIEQKTGRKSNNPFNTKEFLMLYKSNQLHLIQDFLFKITNLKITSDTQLNANKDIINLNIFGSITYLEIKSCPINNISHLQTLRNQLEILICLKSINKVNELLHLCGRDQSSPINWPKLHTMNLSYNNLKSLDNSFVNKNYF